MKIIINKQKSGLATAFIHTTLTCHNKTITNNYFIITNNHK